MKKLVLIMLVMIFAVCQAYAQTSEEVVMPQDTSVVQPTVAASATDTDVLIALLTELSQKMLEKSESASDPTQTKVLVPVQGKNRFSRKHLIYQELGISTLANKDKDGDDSDTDNDSKGLSTTDQEAVEDMSDMAEQISLGFNVDYTLKFVPGTIQGEELELNRFGFAYSLGLLAAFDNHNSYGVTCDFMGKFGVETGNGHVMGVGLDGLVGVGKSSGSVYFLDGEDPVSYTDWCLKYGAQFWIKTNLLTTGLKNTDVLAFARFIYSKDPYPELQDMDDIIAVWNEESWTFGVTLRYRF